MSYRRTNLANSLQLSDNLQKLYSHGHTYLIKMSLFLFKSTNDYWEWLTAQNSERLKRHGNNLNFHCIYHLTLISKSLGKLRPAFAAPPSGMGFRPYLFPFVSLGQEAHLILSFVLEFRQIETIPVSFQKLLLLLQ